MGSLREGKENNTKTTKRTEHLYENYLRLFVLTRMPIKPVLLTLNLSVPEIDVEQRQRQLAQKKGDLFVRPQEPSHCPVFTFLNPPHTVGSAYTITLKLNSCVSIRGSTYSPSHF